MAETEETGNFMRLKLSDGDYVYLRSIWQTTNFSVVVFDGFQAWSRSVTTKEVGGIASEQNIDVGECMRSVRVRLTRQHPTSSYSMSLDRNAANVVNLYFTIDDLWEGEVMDFKLRMEGISDVWPVICEMLNYLADTNDKLKEQLMEAENEFQKKLCQVGSVSEPEPNISLSFARSSGNNPRRQRSSFLEPRVRDISKFKQLEDRDPTPNPECIRPHGQQQLLCDIPKNSSKSMSFDHGITKPTSNDILETKRGVSYFKNRGAAHGGRIVRENDLTMGMVALSPRVMRMLNSLSHGMGRGQELDMRVGDERGLKITEMRIPLREEQHQRSLMFETNSVNPSVSVQTLQHQIMTLENIARDIARDSNVGTRSSEELEREPEQNRVKGKYVAEVESKEDGSDEEWPTVEDVHLGRDSNSRRRVNVGLLEHFFPRGQRLNEATSSDEIREKCQDPLNITPDTEPQSGASRRQESPVEVTTGKKSSVTRGVPVEGTTEKKSFVTQEFPVEEATTGKKSSVTREVPVEATTGKKSFVTREFPAEATAGKKSFVTQKFPVEATTGKNSSVTLEFPVEATAGKKSFVTREFPVEATAGRNSSVTREFPVEATAEKKSSVTRESLWNKNIKDGDLTTPSATKREKVTPNHTEEDEEEDEEEEEMSEYVLQKSTGSRPPWVDQQGRKRSVEDREDDSRSKGFRPEKLELEGKKLDEGTEVRKRRTWKPNRNVYSDDMITPGKYKKRESFQKKQVRIIASILRKEGNGVDKAKRTLYAKAAFRPPEKKHRRSDCDEEANVVVTNVPDSDFYNFDKDRVEALVKADQIWAIYADKDEMPRSYVRIRKVFSAPKFEASITWLTPHQPSVEAKQWSESSGYAISCGEFEDGEESTLTEINCFSHKMEVGWVSSKVMTIYPREGEVWALFFTVNEKEKMTATSHARASRFRLVEITEDVQTGTGPEIIVLGRVSGFRTIWRERYGKGRLPTTDLSGFSHRVPAYRLQQGHELKGITLKKRSWDIDPAGVPPAEGALQGNI